MAFCHTVLTSNDGLPQGRLMTTLPCTTPSHDALYLRLIADCLSCAGQHPDTEWWRHGVLSYSLDKQRWLASRPPRDHVALYNTQPRSTVSEADCSACLVQVNTQTQDGGAMAFCDTVLTSNDGLPQGRLVTMLPCTTLSHDMLCLRLIADCLCCAGQHADTLWWRCGVL